MTEVDMEIKELGYALIGAPDLQKWRDYGTQVLGMSDHKGPDGALYLKMDTRDFRLAVIQQEKNDFLSAGWGVSSEQAFNERRDALVRAGVTVKPGNEADKKLRRVRDFFWFQDPSGQRHEVYWGPISSYTPFVSPVGVTGFVTSDMGFGHVVMATLKIEETMAFWQSVMNFGISDVISFDMGPERPPIRIVFMHCDNGRQHSLAIAELEDPTGLQHLMVEVKTVDDVGFALDRVANTKTPLALSLGRHVNDNMLSFYMVSPSGFMVEFGTDADVVDWSRHNVFESTRGSHWGHRPQG
jgi:3,4-dihydroxy-9,10-secoandrosta-1,3,5(10)-triene-9,17-dione 4,5-dioxygenase